MSAPARPPASSPLSPRFVIEANACPASPPPKAIPAPPPPKPKPPTQEDGTDRKHIATRARRASKIEFVKDLHAHGGRATFSTTGGIVRICCDVQCTKGCSEARDLVISSTSTRTRSKVSSATLPKPKQVVKTSNIPVVPDLLKPMGGRRTSHPYSMSIGDISAISLKPAEQAEIMKSPIHSRSLSSTDSFSSSASASGSGSGSGDSGIIESQQHNPDLEKSASVAITAVRYPCEEENSSQWSQRSALDTPQNATSTETAIELASPPLHLYASDRGNAVTVRSGEARAMQTATATATSTATATATSTAAATSTTAADVKIDIKPKQKEKPWVIGGAVEVTCPRALATANHLLERTGSFQTGVAFNYTAPPSKTTRFLNGIFSSTAISISLCLQLTLAGILCFFGTCPPSPLRSPLMELDFFGP